MGQRSEEKQYGKNSPTTAAPVDDNAALLQRVEQLERALYEAYREGQRNTALAYEQGRVVGAFEARVCAKGS